MSTGRTAAGAGSLILLAGILLAQAPSTPLDKIAALDYNRDIRPILSEHCYACHGPLEGRQKGGLRLDHKETALGKLKSGSVAIVPGHPSRSQLYARITAADAEKMPPAQFGKPLSVTQIEILKKWLEQGAAWSPHWSYTPPRRPPLPTVTNSAWPRNGIDRFILARLEQEGLRPSPEADRATLLRRLSFDLIGLPPTPAEVAAFRADPDPNAYEKVVDRLLASPHFGERLAQHWLDLARFADTNGYHIDNHRDMWKWRDWVIDAFNANKPFDEFTVEQLAGDLLPPPLTPPSQGGVTKGAPPSEGGDGGVSQKIASGFHRNVMVNFEGGADPNEYAVKYVNDRVVTTATVWLGTTLACTECHNHPYDPFTQKDFYRLFAFFNNVPEKGLDGQKDNPVPSLRVPTAEQAVQMTKLRQQIAVVESRINKELARVKLDDAGTTSLDPPAEPREYVWVDDELPSGAVPQGNEGKESWRWYGQPEHPVFSGKYSSKRTASGLSQQVFTGANPELRVGAGDKLFVHVYLDPKDPPKALMLQFHDGTWEHRAYWGTNEIPWGADNTASRFAMGPLPKVGEWVRLEVAPRSIGLAADSHLDGLAFTQVGGTVYWDRAGIVTRSFQGARLFDSQAAWEAAEKGNTKTLPQSIQEALKIAPAQRTEPHKRELKNYFIQHAYTKTRELFEPLTQEQTRLKKLETSLELSMPVTMVMQEMPRPRETFVLRRGDFQSKGEKVTPGVPASLPPLPDGIKADRLALARWLADPKHPLVGRVTVNRFWQLFFGTGLVKTSDDFGAQGEWPSHPELLDWLACEFVATSPPLAKGGRGGWDIKAFVKLLVTSATYRQATKVTPELLRLDPYNRLLARGPRFRLDAEMIRDNALAVSGLLDRRLGGPSVRPYQPSGLWEAISFGGDYSSQTYEQSRGQDLYRRGLYVYWKRSLPYPSLVAFDAPSREICCDRRPRTNTPLQALTLLNDPVYIEAARVLGQRVLKEGGVDLTQRLSFAFELCTARPPRPEELKILTRIYEQQLARFQKDKDAALKLVRIGEAPRPDNIDVSELAAWTALGNILLNLDETVTKG